MLTINNTTLLGGHLAKDPEIRKIKSKNGEMSVMDLTIAVNPETANENAKADFIRATVWGALADAASKYIAKGSGVAVIGALNTGEPYKDKNGVTQYPIGINVESMDFSKDLSLNLNDQTIIGHLTKDPEIAYTKTGIAVSRFVLGVNRPGKDSKSDFIQVVCYGKQAEFSSKYLAKGMRVYVNGRISTGSYQNKDGFVVYTTEVVANKIKFAKKKADSQTAQQPATNNTQYQEVPQQVEQFNPGYEDVEPAQAQYQPPEEEWMEDDSLPF